MKIAIITGGVSGERTVSIASANNIQNIIDFAETKMFVFPEDKKEFILNYESFDLAIPVIHGKGGEDGSVQGLFEQLGLPYIFSGIQAHSIAIDKKRTKRVAELLGLRIAKELEPNCFPFFAKPRFGGSSVNSGMCRNEKEYSSLAGSHEELILEEPLHGREFTVGVVEYNGQSSVLPVIEIITPKDTFFGYEEKYNPDKLAQEICPADIPQELNTELQSAALAVHKELDVKHISRSDFIVTDNGRVYFLEINTIPGMTNTSLIPKMLKEVGIDLRLLLIQWCGINQ